MAKENTKRQTKDELAASFKALLCKLPMEKITIKDITDGAGVIRPTFYNHFTDKYELLEYIIRNDLLLPIQPLLVNDLLTEGLTLLFTNIKNERAFYERAVWIEGQNSFESVARAEVARFLREVIAKMQLGAKHQYPWIDMETISEYYAQSMCFVAITWIKRDFLITPKELAEVYDHLTKSSMVSILKEFG